MSPLARTITPDEVAAYRKNGVVLLRSVLDLSDVNTVWRCIDAAINTTGQSPNEYYLTELTDALERKGHDTIQKRSDGRHDFAKNLRLIRASVQPLLLDEPKTEKGSYQLDAAVGAHCKEFRRYCVRDAAPEIAAALLFQ